MSVISAKCDAVQGVEPDEVGRLVKEGMNRSPAG